MTPNTAIAPGSGGTSGTNGVVGGGSGGGSDGGLKKGPWTASEDAILMEYVRKHGEGNWNAVQRNSGLNRCGKSCRLRWANHLRPNLKKGAFSPEEERLILELHAKYGNKWARMAAQLPGRTDNEIKNYWNTRVKRRQRQGLPLYPHDIQPKSQPTTPTSSVPPTAPSTPTSSTPTTPTGSIFHFHNHSPIHSLSSSTPPPHSPLSSPHQPDQTFSSFPLMGSNSFTFHRPPPILGTPIRFKQFRNNAAFSHPISVTPQRSATVVVQSPFPSPQLSRVDSFQFPVTVATNSPQILQTQFKTDGPIMSSCINSVKPELPSTQFPQNAHSSLTLNDAKISSPMTYSTSGLLEDLLEEAQALACDVNLSKATTCLVSQEEQRLFDGFNKLEDSNTAYLFLSAKPKEEGGDHHGSSANEDWSKLLNAIPSNMQVPQWFTTKAEEVSYGQTSSLAADDDNVGLDVQHIASLFPVTTEPDQAGRTNTTCPWDNLPGIC